MPTVTAVGLAAMDFVFAVDTQPERGRRVFASSLVAVGGGSAATAAVTVAALGGVARFVGRIGDDAIGDQIIDGFARRNVDTSGVRRIRGVASPLSSILVEPDGERTIVNYTDRRLHAPEDVVTGADLVGSDAVLADMRWPTGSLSALRAAAGLGIPSVLDFGETPDPDLVDGLDPSTYVVFSAPALAELTGTTDPEQGLRRIAERTRAWVGVTIGERGVVWIDEGRVVHAPPYSVDAVDTLGAGDVYHGAFALGIAEGRDIHEVVRRAAAVAALKCTRFGGRAGIPSAGEVDAFMEQNRG